MGEPRGRWRVDRFTFTSADLAGESAKHLRHARPVLFFILPGQGTYPLVSHSRRKRLILGQQVTPPDLHL